MAAESKSGASQLFDGQINARPDIEDLSSPENSDAASDDDDNAGMFRRDQLGRSASSSSSS
jgi:hypothetical protein